MKRSAILFSILGAMPNACWPQADWTGPNNELLPDSHSRKSVGGFSATLVATKDPEWREKLLTRSATPRIISASTVKNGEVLYVLAFISNPKVGQDEFADVVCDTKVVRPDGSISVDQKDYSCLKMRMEEDPDGIWPIAAGAIYRAEPTDLRGEWVVTVKIVDRVRGLALPLKLSFVVE